MRDFSLRFPYLIYLCIASILVGAIIAPVFRDMPLQEPTVDMLAHEMAHGTLQVDPDTAPQIRIEVDKDPKTGWNLTLLTENFTFSPAGVNGPHVPNEGHAHLYIDDIKVARMYGPHFHIPDLPLGDHVVTVNLSTNDHSYYVIGEDRIAAELTVTQDILPDAEG
ncbi:hypothetical protein [Pseudooctadecabacter sp.]|uniref:hypothetical protein n=1 Tax=Pseudooctadecabacter sp. TaxID=1966338 RepID=UPI0025FC1503|nr:hypothetical protein [Pseudooctadecabacter sp.]